jgi:hypothetical protein
MRYAIKVESATGSTCELFFQNSDGSLFLSADIAEGTYPAITYSDGNTVASGDGYDEIVAPSPRHPILLSITVDLEAARAPVFGPKSST